MNKNKDFKIIGHRGAPVYKPENTLASFNKAFELGVDMIELDVHLTKDKQPVVIHDRTVNRTTSGKGKVSNLTLNEIRKLDAGEGEKIPTLEEVFDLIGRKKGEVNIEIKESHVLEKIFLYLDNKVIKKKVLISSSSINLLEKAKIKDSELRIGIVAPLTFGIIKSAYNLGAESIHPFFLSVHRSFIQKAHQKNLKVYPYPWGTKKENPSRVQRIINLGIDGIFLNKPNII